MVGFLALLEPVFNGCFNQTLLLHFACITTEAKRLQLASFGSWLNMGFSTAVTSNCNIGSMTFRPGFFFSRHPSGA